MTTDDAMTVFDVSTNPGDFFVRAIEGVVIARQGRSCVYAKRIPFSYEGVNRTTQLWRDLTWQGLCPPMLSLPVGRGTTLEKVVGELRANGSLASARFVEDARGGLVAMLPLKPNDTKVFWERFKTAVSG